MKNYKIRHAEKINLFQCSMNLDLIKAVSEKLARRYTIIPFEMDEYLIKVAMVDPSNFLAIKDISIMSKRKVIPFFAEREEIIGAINRLYASSKAIESTKEVEKRIRLENRAKPLEIKPLKEEAGSGAYLEWAESMIEQGIAMNASDIHIEPLKDAIKLRYRIDGRLQETQRLDKEMMNPLITCIKMMAKLDISEKRMPQDGRISKQMGDEMIDLRVNILPTLFGEKMMIRIIYQVGKQLELEELGFNPEDFEKFKRLLLHPYGLILLTGPTGSGKSTTLATILRELNQPYRNIVTIEDPVETIIEGVNQVVVNEKTGMDFTSILRAVLRQDPDILMIGEMRDEETAKIAVKSAMTGHLVLSTLHTNDATSSIMRLMDMGIEPYVVGSALKGVIAQRLVRKICPHCKQLYQVTEADEKLYQVRAGTIVYQGVGCPLCYGTGYKGRKAVHEVFILDSEMQEALSIKKLTMEQLRHEAIKRGMRTLRDNLYEEVLAGVTSIQEMQNIAYEW